MIEEPLIATCEAELHATTRTEIWWRKWEFFLRKDRGNGIDECEIVWSDLEGSRAIQTLGHVQ
ncbi:MAG: hypothetical protein Greene041662_150 [Candidatus Peregrinibacteria bacterium Greene0416_62]|nr:MAG: hypothetical protein Greene041662_150 [Candidatus Peregrinibacteria bacterium Greene0416_62]